MTPIRLAALADLHVGRAGLESPQKLLTQAADTADILIIAGDLTDLGHIDEAQSLVRDLASIKKPIVAVLGNHDYHSGQVDALKQTFTHAGLHILDGSAIEIQGVGFAGAKGFAGGFDHRMLAPWGEDIIKRFVHEAIEESLKLETALATLRTTAKVAILHYSPLRATVEGEPAEILPFLGSSRLEEPLNRFGVTVAFHGHAHHGAFHGETSGRVPVFNVSAPLLGRQFPERPPFFVYDIIPG